MAIAYRFLNCGLIKDLPWCTLSLALANLWIFYAAPKDSVLFYRLALNKEQLLDPLRYFFSHFLHTDLNHLFWNVGALIILGSIIEARSRLLLLGSHLAGVLAIAIWFSLEHEFEVYVGISGILNTFFVVALYCLYNARNHFSKYNVLLGSLFLIYLLKNTYELATGAALFSSNAEWQITPGAHIAGMSFGILYILLIQKTIKKGSK